VKRSRLWALGAVISLLAALPAASPAYDPADAGQRPERAPILPDQFLRGYDPITAYFTADEGPGRGDADDGARRLKITPAWPGAWFWLDRRTLQFRPAEPWPALARFQVESSGGRRVLTTMMTAPSALSPGDGSEDLRPFRSFTVSFPQALAVDSLRKMLSLELRDLPGSGDQRPVRIDRFGLAPLPRASQRDPAAYAVTLEEEVPEGKQLRVQVALALGDEGTVLWTGKLSTQPPFHLARVRCGGAETPVVAGGVAAREAALACGNRGERPELHFSSPPKDLSLSALRQLVRLEPAVADLGFDVSGARVTLRGRFLPDVLYRLRLEDGPIRDETGRALRSPGGVELFFYLGARSPFLRWSQGTALLEAHGPRTLPLVGYGEARADVRIHRLDPLHPGLWPFPPGGLTVDEDRAPPFPGEEPSVPDLAQGPGGELGAHLRLLGSPLVSRVVTLPLEKRAGATKFGLDLAPLLDPAVGKNRPGTYLVGLRQLAGPPQRSWVRVQVTNLSLTVVEERERAVLFVRALDDASPVAGAVIRIDGKRRVEVIQNGRKVKEEQPATVELVADGEGRVQVGRLVDWSRLLRIDVSKGEDHLVLDPGEPPPRFAANHWSYSSRFLEWLLSDPPPPANEKLLAFILTERPIYKPGETVHLKGWLRHKKGGQLTAAGSAEDYLLRIEMPNGQSVALPLAFTELGGFSADWTEKDPPSGEFKVLLLKKRGTEVLGERAFKIEAYRIPTFEVQLSGPAVAPLDAPIPVKAVARFYAGGAAAGQKIRWNVTQRPTLHVPKGRESFLFASSAQFARPGAARPPSSVRRDGVLDAQGSDTMKVNPALDVDGSPRIYRFEATVTGPDDQEVSAAQEVRALPPFVLGLKLDRYLEKAREVVPRIIAVGPDDKPVKGQEVVVRLYRRVWHSQLRETAFATGEARYVTDQEDVKISERSIRTDAEPVAVPFAIKEAGVYVVELTGRDRLGRVQTLSADLYAGGPGPVAWQKPKEGIFSVVPDKKGYAPGDVARLVLESPFQAARALVVVEEPTGNVYRWLDVAGAKGVAELEIQPQHVPNLPVHVILFRGRIGEGATDDARYRPQTVASSLELDVEPTLNRVTVKVEHPESVRPGSRTELIITLKDERGRPLAGEATLWLVDEAVLSLAREGALDPLTRFIERNRSATSIRDTRNLVLGRILEEEEPGGDGSGNDEDGRRTRTVRKNFQTVPFWQATVQVPASGRLVVPVTLSDDLTDFRVRAVAASGLTRFGLHQSTLHVRLPVLIQPQLPRLVREGDRFWPGGVARMLEGAEGPGVVDIEVLGPVDARKTTVPIALDLQKPASALTPARITAVGEPSTLTVRVGVTRKGDGVGDAFEVKLPVLPDRAIERFSQVSQVAPGRYKLPAFPEPPRPGTATQEIVVTSVPGVLEALASLDYLSTYPHECLEQRGSRLFGEVALAGTLRDLGLGDLYGARPVADARRFVKDLAVHQDAQGLFAYWPGGPGDVALTAQVLELSAALKAAGVETDPAMVGRAEEGLKRVLRSDYPFLAGYRFNQQTSAMRALARYGKLDEHYLADLYQRRADMDAVSLADLAFSMSRRPEAFRADLETLKQELWATVVVKLRNGKEVVEKIQRDRSGWGWTYLGSSPATYASVWRGLLAVDSRNPRQDLLREALLSRSRPEVGFGDTYSNRRALEALADYLARPRPDLPGGALALEGAGDLAVDGTRKAARLSRRSEQPLTGSVRGAPLGVRVAYSFLPASPGSEVKALRQGLVVSRSWSAVRDDGSLSPPVEDKAGEARKVHPGDVFELHTRLITDEEHGWVALVVPFAAGLEPLNPALAGSGPLARPSEADSLEPTYVQRLDGEVRYYFARLPRGSHGFHVRVRAASEGSFVHPAPWAELMYRQEIRGRGEGMRVVVVGEHEKE
jgi:alpha-2-macroglobulin